MRVLAAPCCGAEAPGQEVEGGRAAARVDPLLRGESVAQPGRQGAARDPPLPVAAGAHLEPVTHRPTPRLPCGSEFCKTPQPPEGAMQSS